MDRTKAGIAAAIIAASLTLAAPAANAYGLHGPNSMEASVMRFYYASPSPFYYGYGPTFPAEMMRGIRWGDCAGLSAATDRWVAEQVAERNAIAARVAKSSAEDKQRLDALRDRLQRIANGHK